MRASRIGLIRKIQAQIRKSDKVKKNTDQETGKKKKYKVMHRLERSSCKVSYKWRKKLNTIITPTQNHNKEKKTLVCSEFDAPG